MLRVVISSLTQTAYITAITTNVLRQVPYMGEKYVVLSLLVVAIIVVARQQLLCGTK